MLFRKLFNKTYSEKLDYLWRNEIRILKEELENFLITIEHQHISNHNNAYNDWLLVQAFNRLQYIDGIDEKTEKLVAEIDSLKKLEIQMKNDTLEIERLAREKYGMIKQGEKVIFINKKKVDEESGD